MNNRKVAKALLEFYEYDGISDYLKSNGVIAKTMPKDFFCDNEDAVLMNNKIYYRRGLSREYKKFLTLHEIGHKIMHFGDGYSFNMNVYKNKCEVEANKFACLYLLDNVDVSNINIIEYLCNCGVPHKIAASIFENLQFYGM